MDIANIPKPFRTRLEENGQDIGGFNDEIVNIIYNAVDEEETWGYAKDRIFNGLQYFIDEAKKAQNLFCKE
jgi:hypothetical protein